MNNTGTYLKPASEVSVGDTVCEADGFMWKVINSAFASGKYTLTLAPVFTLMTARGNRTVSVRRSASVRVVTA